MQYAIAHLLALLPGKQFSYDRKVVRERFAKEGTGFLTALEALGNHLQVSLDRRIWTPIPHFQRRKPSVIPQFLGSLIGVVFDDNGTIRKPTIESVSAVRLILQVAFAFKKFSCEPSLEMQLAAVNSFKSIQQELRRRRLSGFYEFLGDSTDSRLMYMRHFLTMCTKDLNVTDGRYGPGSNTIGIDPQLLSERTPNPSTFPKGTMARSVISQCVDGYHTVRLPEEEVLPLFPNREFNPPVNINQKALDPDWDRFFDEAGCLHDYCELVAVPKNRAKARLIGKMHPDYVYCQLAYERAVKNVVQNSRLSKWLPFRDQTIPSDRALQASRSGDWSTLDLSCASDYVAWDLVKAFFPWDFVTYVNDTRARYAHFGDERIECFSYGQMGDGTTFVVLSLICASVCYAVQMSKGILDPEFIVFGDDIQVPTDHAQETVMLLHLIGLRVNLTKSFYRPGGAFRESCNGWGYAGANVKPVFYRYQADVASPRSIMSQLDVARELDLRGYATAAELLYKEIENILKTSLPHLHSKHGYLTRVDRAGNHPSDLLAQGTKRLCAPRIQTKEFLKTAVGDLRCSILRPEEDFYSERTRKLRSLRGFRFIRIVGWVSSEPRSWRQMTLF